MSADPAMTLPVSEWTDEVAHRANAQRHRLIEKKLDGGGLGRIEHLRLEALQNRCGEYMDRRFPLPDPPESEGER